MALSLQTLPLRADTESNRCCRTELGWLTRLPLQELSAIPYPWPCSLLPFPSLSCQPTSHSIDHSSRWLEIPDVNQVSRLAGQTTNNEAACWLYLSTSMIANILSVVLCAHMYMCFHFLISLFPIYFPFPDFSISYSFVISSLPIPAFRPTHWDRDWQSHH